MPVAVAEARNLIEAGNRVAFFAASTGELERLADVLQEYAVPYQLGMESTAGARPSSLNAPITLAPSRAHSLIKGHIRRGAVLLDSQFAFSARKIFSRSSDLIARQPTQSQLAAFAADVADLKPGDFVVHTTHGVGQFLGIREITQGDQTGDFMLIEYAGRIEAVRAAHAPGSGPEVSRRRRSQAASRPPRRRHLGKNEIARQSENARHGG